MNIINNDVNQIDENDQMKREAGNGAFNELRSSLVDAEGQQSAIDGSDSRNINAGKDESQYEDDLKMVKLVNLDGYNEYQRAIKIISGEDVSPAKHDENVADSQTQNKIQQNQISNNTLD